MQKSKEILNDDKASRADFVERMRLSHAGGYFPREVVLTHAEVDALKQGACLALDDGEYTTFITIEK